MVAFALWSAPLAADEITIAALGDSLTQGYGLPVEDGLVPQLEAWLRARGHAVTIINAGVSGDTSAGGLARVGWTLGDGGVDAMIVALGGNDILRGLPPETTRENLRGILEAGTEAGVSLMLVGLPAPGNYGADYKTAFDAIYPDLAAEYGAIHVENFLAAISTAEDPLELMQDDGIHPNAQGVAQVVTAIGPNVEMLIARVQAE